MEVACSAEEAGEEVEGVMGPTASAVAGFVLGEAFVAVLIVDFARFGFREGFIGFGYLDEALGCCFVVSLQFRTRGF